MCLAIPGKVKEIKGEQVLVQYPKEIRPAFSGGEPVKIGDYVMVQMGIVIKILNQKEVSHLHLN
jgi:hydrogenase assembly chaperone HypC/HupF